MRYVRFFLLAGMLASLLNWTGQKAVQAAERPSIDGAFKTYYQSHGGLAVFGYPLTPELAELGPEGQVYTVQYFERNRFELHPENKPPYDVLLGTLGNWSARDYVAVGHPAFGRVTNPNNGLRFFKETGHSLGGAFRAYWDSYGGLAIYGFPISEEFAEVSPTDGKTYTVQYFERNRFERHPENAGTRFAVQLGLLGNQFYSARYPGGQADWFAKEVRWAEKSANLPGGWHLITATNGRSCGWEQRWRIVLHDDVRATWTECNQLRIWGQGKIDIFTSPDQLQSDMVLWLHRTAGQPNAFFNQAGTWTSGIPVPPANEAWIGLKFPHGGNERFFVVESHFGDETLVNLGAPNPEIPPGNLY